MPVLIAAPASALCVTAGRVEAASEHGFHVNVGGMRGRLAGEASTSAEIAFTYRGPSRTTTPLANGEVRRQVGLKLRARDTCNVVYVMWHLAPTPGVFVSVKHNPGKETHRECGANGYDNLRAPGGEFPPPVVAGEPHALRADLDGDALSVRADGRLVWQGTLPVQAFSFDGPPGVRTDNAELDFELRVPQGQLAAATPCPDGE